MIKNMDKNNSIFIKSDLDFVNLSRTAFLLYIFVTFILSLCTSISVCANLSRTVFCYWNENISQKCLFAALKEDPSCQTNSYIFYFQLPYMFCDKKKTYTPPQYYFLSKGAIKTGIYR